MKQWHLVLDVDNEPTSFHNQFRSLFETDGDKHFLSLEAILFEVAWVNPNNKISVFKPPRHCGVYTTMATIPNAKRA